MMTVEQAIQRVSRKFVAWNGEDATNVILTREEWDAIRSHIEGRVVMDEQIDRAMTAYDEFLGSEDEADYEAMRAALIAAMRDGDNND